jgi:predicted amidohydrolase YtcJ
VTRARVNLAILAAAALWACAQSALEPRPNGPLSAPAADAIWGNGEILTMEGDEPQYVEAVAVRDGRITFAGARAEAEKLRGPATQLVDLEGRTLVPGFVDAHGDLFATGFAASAAKLDPPPDGTVNAVTALTRALYAWSKTDAAQKLGWIVGTGYDESQMRERRAPTADELDEVSRTVPVVALHSGGRAAALNNAALARLDLARKGAKSVVKGAAFESVRAALPSFDPLDEIAKGQAVYASLGFTAAQETGASRAELAALASAADSGKLYLDVTSYADVGSDALDVVSSRYRAKTHVSHYRVAGWALALSGPADAAFAAKLDEAFARGEQLVVRCEGAAALDAFADALHNVGAGEAPADRRPIALASEPPREDQLETLESLGAIALSETPASLTEAMRARARVTSYTALQRLTLDAARASFQENERGSIRAGKLADFAVLEANPLRLPPKLARLEVVKTIKNGREIWARPRAQSD